MQVGFALSARFIKLFNAYRVNLIPKQMTTFEGSAKDILVESMPEGDRMGAGYFIPKDSFSIFDYKTRGKWPFDIPHKGIAMAYIINKSFEIAQASGIRTCFIGAGEDRIKIHVVRVPGRDGFPLEPDKVEIGTKNRVVDLEVIFNYYLHPRSSLLRDLRSGKKDFRDYGFTEMPQGGEVILSAAGGEFKLLYTTKYDKRGDIPLSEEEAKTRSRLTDGQWQEGQDAIRRCIPLISKYAEQKNLLRADGKYELFVDSEGHVGLADSFGNPEEDRYLLEIKDLSVIERFLYFYQRRWNLDQAKVSALLDQVRKMPKRYQDVSKQFLRNWYIDNGWKDLYAAGKSNVPPSMPQDALAAYSDAMLSFAALWSGRTGDLINATGVLVRPIVEVAGELFVLEQLNKTGLTPSA